MENINHLYGIFQCIANELMIGNLETFAEYSSLSNYEMKLVTFYLLLAVLMKAGNLF